MSPLKCFFSWKSFFFFCGNRGTLLRVYRFLAVDIPTTDIYISIKPLEYSVPTVSYDALKSLKLRFTS